MKPIFIVTCTAAAIIGVLAYFAAISVTFVPGVAALYPAAAFEAVFGAWFGIYGAIASYIGLLFAGATGGWFSIQTGIFLSVSDFILALAPAIAARRGVFDPALPTASDAFKFWAVSLFLGSLPGSLVYNFINLQLGALAGWNSFWVAVLGWNIGNAIVLAALGVPLARIGTALIKKRGLYVQGLL
ncbi:MAG: hypothetical protein AW12_00254 [Candidatus Accumulibacter sp. BA-94]|uniref:hypothetical protein n=1 Tax=Accumulibacter sp. TaxID=2053492 RepID=UPI0004480FB0|nr:hypothetical protein [Accumulibacter sp.]EXI92774.1 MAG: hypothetical protein AW12_00254 [Candidatus Accumulibacter sp. BA-94]HRD86638.1 hypothetical protein [Accumulibacter sp.]